MKKKNQYIFGILILSALLIGATIGYTLAQGNTFIISQGIYPRGDFHIFKEGSTYYAKTTYGRIVYSSASAVSVIQSSHDALINGGTIFLSEDIDAGTGTLNITNSKISIITDKVHLSDQWQTPRIGKILLDSTSADLKDILISGLCIREIDFYANNHPVWGVLIENSMIMPDDAYAYGKGIRIRGSGSLGYSMFIRFRDCSIQDWYDQTTNQQGAISVLSNVQGTLQWYFERLDYKSHQNGSTFFYADTGCNLGYTVFDSMSWVEINHANCKMFYFSNASKIELHITNCLFETKDSITMFTYESQVTYNVIWFSNNDWNIGDTATDIGTFIDNTVHFAWLASAPNGIYGSDNVFHSGEYAEFSLGTTGGNTRFMFRVDFLYRYGFTEKFTTYWGQNEASNGDYIQHDIIDTPTFISLQVWESDDAYICQVQERNSTHFRIFLYDDTGSPEDVDKTILWYAEFKDDH